jgi:hypothetical protein
MYTDNIETQSFFKQYLPQILGLVVIIFAILVFFEIKGINLNEDGSREVLKKVISVKPIQEGFTKQAKRQAKKKQANKNTKQINKNTVKPVVLEKPNDGLSEITGFCNPSKFTPSDINNKCSQLTKENCNVTGCCVYLNGNKCVGGDKNGPTFLSDGKGKLLNVDYYYYKNQCYGNCKNK